MHNLGKTWLLCVVILFLAACKNATIELPTNDYIDNQAPPLFKVAFSSGIPGDLRLELNNQNVTSLFSVQENGAEAQGSTLSDYLYPGRNLFRVAAGGRSSQVYFYYDVEGPAIHILSADRSTGLMEGYLNDPGGVASLTLDGSGIALDADNHFSTVFANQATNRFVATDHFGNSSTTDYAREDREFNPGISARLNQGGISFLGYALSDALGNLDFEAAMASLNPIFDFNFIGFFTIAVEVQNLYFNQPDIALQATSNNKIATAVDIPDFSIGLTMGGRTAFFIPWRVGGTLYIDNVRFRSNLDLEIDNNDLDVGLQNTNVQLQGVDLDLDYIPNILGFESLLGDIVGGITNFLMPFFTGLIEGVVVPIASEFIGEIPIALDITTPDDETLRVRVLPQYMQTFDNGLTIDLGSRISAPFPSQDAVPSLGSLYVEGETPRIGTTTPEGQPFDVGAAISANLINQAFYAAHASGITTMTIRPDNTPGATPEGVSVIQTPDDDIRSNDLIGMSIKPASPPYIALMDQGGAYGVLGWRDLTLEFDLLRTDWSEYRNVFTVTFDLEVPFELGATDDGFLQIGIEQLPTINVTYSRNAGLIQLSPRFINRVIDRFMPVILPKVSERLKSIPLPRIANHSIHPRDFWITGSGDNTLALAGDLVRLADTAAAPAPTTILAFSGSVQTRSRSTVLPKNSDTDSNEPELHIENGEVSINVRGQNPSNSPLEFRYRVDGGPWSVWKQRNSIQLLNLLGGEHVVEVCSRTVLLKQEQSCPSVSFTTQAL